MATISQKEWNRYIARLRNINDKAAEEFKNLIIDKGGYGHIERQKLIDYAYGISTKYGEASAALSAEMYDAIAELSGAAVPAALPAETASYSEVSKTVNGILKKSQNENMLAQGIGRLVKMAGTDTILSNAYRDRPKGRGSKKKHSGAQVAWIPSGDTCPFCIMLASKGWQNQTVWGANNHSEHIHANCDCTYAVRFNNDLDVEGYDPDELRKEYYSAGRTQDERLNAMRRENYAKNKDKINAQKRAAYAKRNEIAEEGHRGKNRSKEIARSIIESPDYGRRLSSVDPNGAVTKNIIKESRKILNHRNGTEYEDLMFIDTRNGKYLVRTDYDAVRRAMPSKKMVEMVEKADDYTIAVLHNHSGSTVPSPADIASLVNRKNAYGVIIGHDGSIYKYTCRDYNPPLYGAAVAKLDETGYNELGIKTFISEAKEAGITIEVL